MTRRADGSWERIPNQLYRCNILVVQTRVDNIVVGTQLTVIILIFLRKSDESI